jgi:hypothetical protein
MLEFFVQYALIKSGAKRIFDQFRQELEDFLSDMELTGDKLSPNGTSCHSQKVTWNRYRYY